MKITVVIPCLNEEQTIGSTISQFFDVDNNLEFVIIDNGSVDRTSEIAHQKLCELGAEGIILSESRRGKGQAIRSAFLASDADIFVMVDGDLTYSPEDLKKLVQPIAKKQAHMVVGDRLINGDYFHENKRPFHNWGNKFINKMISLLFKTQINDVLSGFRAFSRPFVNTYPVMPSGFELEVDLTIHALDKRIQIVEVPIKYQDRPSGSSSKLNTFRDGAKIIFKIITMLRLYKPEVFFGTISLVLLGFGILAGIQPVLDWFEFRYVYKVPLALLAVGFIILSALSVSVGLILDSVAKLSRNEFELRFIQENKRNILS